MEVHIATMGCGGSSAIAAKASKPAHPERCIACCALRASANFTMLYLLSSAVVSDFASSAVMQ